MFKTIAKLGELTLLEKNKPNRIDYLEIIRKRSNLTRLRLFYDVTLKSDFIS